MALDAVRVTGGSELLSRIEVYLVVMPGMAWFAVLLELSRPGDTWRGRVGEMMARRRRRALALPARRWRAESTASCALGTG